MLVLAAAATLAARVPGELRFSSEFYTEAGGVVGSGVYSAIDWAGGSIGAALALAVLYALGLSLLTGISPSAAISAVRSTAESLRTRLHDLHESRSARRGGQHVPRDPGVEPLEELAPEPDAPPFEVSDTDPTREIEIVLPVRPETSELRVEGGRWTRASTRRHRRRCSASAAGIPSTTSRRPAAGSRGRSRTSGWRRM